MRIIRARKDLRTLKYVLPQVYD